MRGFIIYIGKCSVLTNSLGHIEIITILFKVVPKYQHTNRAIRERQHEVYALPG